MFDFRTPNPPHPTPHQKKKQLIDSIEARHVGLMLVDWDKFARIRKFVGPTFFWWRKNCSLEQFPT